MPASHLTTLPGLHGQFLAQQLPQWLKHATPADLKRWRASQLPTQWTASGAAAWFSQASEAERQLLLDAQQLSRTSTQALTTALKDLQGLGAFAEPLLQARLQEELGGEYDVNTTELVEIHQESALLGSMLRLKPRRQTLMQAALQNFAADTEFEPGSALAPNGAFVLELIPAAEDAYPRFQYRYTSQLETSPEQFAALCHALDLGGQYQTHLQDVFDQPGSGQNVRTLSINAYKDRLRVAAQTALMKGEISDSARQMINGLLEGQRSALFHDKPVICQSLTLFQTSLDGVLVFSANRITSDELEPIVVYVPGAPLYPLKEYASVAEFKQDLRVNLLLPSYLQLLRSVLPKQAQEHTLKRLDEALYDRSVDAAGQLNPQANLHLRDEPIEGDLFGYVQDQQLQRIKANARYLAVPSADADEALKKQRLAYWESIGFNALNAAAFFVPGVGEVMAVVAGAQLVNEIIEGAHAWEAGELDEALAHFESVALNIVMAAGLGTADHLSEPVQVSERVEGLLKVTLPSGEERLWKPDLAPYARTLELKGIAPDEQGLYRVDGTTYVRIDGQICEVAEGSEGRWAVRHPSDPGAYQPALVHNGEGAWQMLGEQPMRWTHEQLLSRLGHVAHGLSDAVLEQAVQISGIDDDVLRRVHLDHLPIPPLLKETLQRFQADRRVSRLITSLSQGLPDVERLELTPSLSQELPRWPQRVFELYDEANLNRPPTRYGADRWPSGRVIRISTRELYANQLADKVLADLDETEALDLFGSSVEADKRLEVLRVLIAERAIKRRGEIFNILYEQGRAPRSLEQTRLIQAFPKLTEAAAQEVIGAADSAERLQLQASDGRVPMRLAEEARVYQRQFVLNRAIQGLQHTTLASLDSDRLALGLLARLPGWTASVRVEIRENVFSGRLLASVGETQGELKILVRRGDLYTAYDAQGLALSKNQQIVESLLQALPDSERRALNLEIHAAQALRTELFSLAVSDRANAAQVLGQQPIRPWFRSPLRLADGRIGYPLGGAVGGLAVDGRLNALFPELGRGGLESMKARLLLENQTLHDGVFKLEAEYRGLQQTLEQWIEDSGDIFERATRVSTQERLLKAWRRMGGRLRGELDLEGLDVGTLPLMTARFEHIRSLNMDRMNLLQLPNGLLRCFPRLHNLKLSGNPLSEIPADIATLTGLRYLSLREIHLRSSESMFEPLRSLVNLQFLDLQSNQLRGIPSTALETLAGLPVLTHLNVRYNHVGWTSAALETLARLPLQELDLSRTELVLDEAGAQVFSRLGRLQRLHLGGNPLARAPELGSLVLLQELQMDRCQLTEWPTGLTTLMNRESYALRSVNLSHNLITQLPDLAATRFGADMRADAGHTLNLYFNPLEPASITRLSAVSAAFVAEFDVPQPLGPVWLQGASQAQLAQWNELFQGQRNAGLRDMLDRLALSREFERNATELRSRVWSMLGLAEQHTQLREELLEIAEAFPVTCGDAGADAFSALETAVLVFTRSLEATSETRGTELFALYKQLFRRHEVQRMADALSWARIRRRQLLLEDGEPTALDPLDSISDALLRSENVDDIEIRLALRQELAGVLDYPEPSNGMLFQTVANLTPKTVQRVADAVRLGDTAANRQAWMVEESNWQRYLRQRYGEQFDSLSAVWSAGLEYLDYCNGGAEEVPDMLDSEVLTVLRTALAQEPLGADGHLLKLEMGSQAYLKAVDALAEARNKAEAALILSLTQAQESAA